MTDEQALQAQQRELQKQLDEIEQDKEALEKENKAFQNEKSKIQNSVQSGDATAKKSLWVKVCDKAKGIVDTIKQKGTDTLKKITKPQDSYDPETERGRAKFVREALNSFISYYQADNTRIPDVGDPTSNNVLRALINEIKTTITEAPAVYLVPLFDKALSGLITNPLECITRDEYKIIWNLNPLLATQVQTALVKSALQLGYSNEKVQQFADHLNRPDTPQESALRRDNPDYADPAFKDRQMINEIESKLKHDKEATDLDLVLFFQSLDSHESFYKYLNKRKKQHADANHPEPGKKAAEDAQRCVVYLVATIFSNIANEAPDKSFSELANRSAYGSAIYAPPPPESQYQILKQKLSNLSKIALPSDSADFQKLSDVFMGYRTNRDMVYSPVTQRSYTDPNSDIEITYIGPDAMLEQLETMAERQHEFLEFGVNLRFLNSNKQNLEDSSYHLQLAKYARESLKSSNLDEINIMPYKELISAAGMHIASQMKYIAAKYGWIKGKHMYYDLFGKDSEFNQQIYQSFIDQYAEDDKYSITILNHCFMLAMTQANGRDALLDEIRTQLRPQLTQDGVPTFLGEETFGGFNIMDISKRLGIHVDDLVNNGEAYLPLGMLTDLRGGHYTIQDITDFIEKMKIEYFQSQVFGNAAWSGEKSALVALDEMGNLRQGGMERLAGWRMKYGIRYMLTNELDPITGNEDLRILSDNDQLLVHAWKRIENVGVSPLRTLIESFLFKDHHYEKLDDDGNLDVRVESKYRSLFEFIYDRYYDSDESTGKGFLQRQGITGREDYVNRFVTLFKNEDGSGQNINLIHEEMSRVLSIITFQRLPTDFITWESPDKTQNGITLFAELKSKYITADPSTDKKRNLQQGELLDLAINDLIQVQQKERKRSIEAMERNKRQMKQHNDANNTYGDLNKFYSDANFWVDENTIRMHLEESLAKKTPEERQARIAMAIDVYRNTRLLVMDKPAHNQFIDLYDPKLTSASLSKRAKREMKKKLEQKEEKMVSRMETYSDAFHKKNLIYPQDTARSFIRHTDTGEDTVARAAEQASVITDTLQKAFTVDIKKACKQAAIKKDFQPLYDFIREVKDKIDTEDGELSKNVVVPLLARRIINTFRKDRKGRGGPAELRDALNDRPDSVSQTYTDQEDLQRAWSWDAEDVHDFLQGLKGLTAGGLAGKEQVRSLKLFGDAGFWRRLKETFLPRIIAAGIGLLVIAALNASKEMQ